MKPRSSRRTAVASHRTTSTRARSRPWRDVLAVATVLTAALPALVWALSAPLPALAVAALAIAVARTLP